MPGADRIIQGMRHAFAALLLLLLTAAPALADATVFIGSTTTPVNRAARGVAIGVGLLVVGFEFEYASTGESEEDGAPSLRTGMGNVLLQTPFPVAGLQFYVTAGGGGYRERIDGGGSEPLHQETHIGINTGGGVKVSLLGPIRARLDYRLFKLRGEPRHSTVHRVYAGLNLAF
jgi:hypothetical protein